MYVINDALGNVYMGTSQDIANRVADHNAGMGATFTNGKKWWRVQPIPTVPSHRSPPSSALKSRCTARRKFEEPECASGF